MPPRNTDFIAEASVQDGGPLQTVAGIEVEETKAVPMVVVWRNVVWFLGLHMMALYGLFLLPMSQWKTIIFTTIIYYMSAFGITAGAHRLWSHKTYRAKLPLRILLAFCNSMAFQNDIIEWSRDHRLHHKFSETDADPHNAKRGFFFSHCGWLMVRKHPQVKEKGKFLDISDLLSDPVCMFQRKYYLLSVFLSCFFLPTFIPWWFWGESLWKAYMVCGVFRYTAVLNFTWCVNSVAHLWGNKPYDHRINPVQNLGVTLGAAGEGYHNYHHTFPSDYSASEFAWKLNPTTAFIDCMAFIGLATNRKKMDVDLVERRKLKTGDGSDGFNLW